MGENMNSQMIDISSFNDEQKLRILYENAKWNRLGCYERGNEEQVMFWSGTLNGIYCTLENLGVTYEWIEGRERDFNQFYEKHEKLNI